MDWKSLAVILIVCSCWGSGQRLWPDGFNDYSVSGRPEDFEHQIATNLSNFEGFIVEIRDTLLTNKTAAYEKLKSYVPKICNEMKCAVKTLKPNSAEVRKKLVSAMSLVSNITKQIGNKLDPRQLVEKVPTLKQRVGDDGGREKRDLTWVKDVAKGAGSLISNQASNVKQMVTSGHTKLVQFASTSASAAMKPIKSVGSTFGSVMNSLKPEIRAIFPGTKWCGDGDVAANYDDVGLFYRTDACCRAHDKCSFNIGADETFGWLRNTGLFTRSACFCDREFYDCLKNASSPIAFDIGHTYFTLLAPQCIGYEFPVTSCKRYEGVLDNKCVEYEVDSTKDPVLQWFNSPDF